MDGFGGPSSGPATGWEDSPPMKTIDSGSAEIAAISAIVPPVVRSDISLSDTTKTTEYSFATLPSANEIGDVTTYISYHIISNHIRRGVSNLGLLKKCDSVGPTNFTV